MEKKKEIRILLKSILVLILITASVAALTATQQLTANVLPRSGLFIKVNSPVNNAIYENRQILVDVDFNTEVALFMLSKSDNRLTTLCRRCRAYNKTQPFDDGFHEIIIRAIDKDGAMAERFVNFTVDTKDPKIKKILPKKGFTNGEFFIQFQEANPKELFINYGNSITGFRNQQIDLSACSIERANTNCNLFIDLTDFDLQEIEYSSNLTDILNKKDISKPIKLRADINRRLSRTLIDEILDFVNNIF